MHNAKKIRPPWSFHASTRPARGGGASRSLLPQQQRLAGAGCSTMCASNLKKNTNLRGGQGKCLRAKTGN